MIFLNQFTLSDYTSQIQDIVVHLLSDERIEVKLAAATTLSGGIQCRFFKLDNGILLVRELNYIILYITSERVELYYIIYY